MSTPFALLRDTEVGGALDTIIAVFGEIAESATAVGLPALFAVARRQAGDECVPGLHSQVRSAHLQENVTGHCARIGEVGAGQVELLLNWGAASARSPQDRRNRQPGQSLCKPHVVRSHILFFPVGQTPPGQSSILKYSSVPCAPAPVQPTATCPVESGTPKGDC